MGNADSGCVGASGDEEEMEAGTSSVLGVSPASGSPGAGSASGGVGGRTNSSLGPGSGLPPPEALLEQVKLRDAAVRMRDSGAAVSESVLARNESALVRWLEERLSRGDETVTLEQFCEMLEGRPAARDECEEAFGQFDAEGDGVVDVENMLMALKNSNGANLQGELSHVIRQLQACSLTPGFVDIFSKSKDRLALHSTKILRFLHRNRIPSNAIPFPVLEGYNNICTMRSSVVQDFLDFLLQKENDLNIENTGELNCDPELDKVKIVTKCYSVIETSSNSADIDKMTNGETVITFTVFHVWLTICRILMLLFFLSDAKDRFKWLRLKPDVVLRRLMIAVAANDQSYMPQQVTVAVGRNPRSLQEIRDVHIPSNVTGFVTLLENANVSSPFVQINIKRCLSDGCDTRIHGLRTVGYQIMKNKGVSVSDASAIWYLSLLTSLVTASMESNPVLVQTVLQNTQKALQHMPPLSLTPGSTEFPKFFSPNILEEVDAFLLRIADCCVTPEAELTLLAFALARGSVAKVITALSSITDHLDTEYKASTLLASMALVRLKLLYKYGKAIQLQLQACDVKGKEEKSGPENILVEPCTGDGFLTETGKTRASIILSTGNEMSLQVTQIRIKVRKGPIGAKCGLVFAYNDGAGKFDAEQHFKRFEKYDTWGLQEYRQFLKNRQDTAERLGVQQLSASGYLREVSDSEDSEALTLTRGDKAEGGLVSGVTLLQKTLYFIQQLAQDMALQKETMFKQRLLLDFSNLNLQLFWSFYNKLRKNLGEEAVKAQVILLQLLQNCFPVLSTSELPVKQQNSNNRGTGQTEAVQELYRHLCEVVDGPEGDSSVKKYLKKEAINTVLNGAAIFFPDRQARRDQLFAMMVKSLAINNKNITEQDQPESVTLTFESLCNYFSDQDPSGLLLLPPKGAPSGFDISPALTVMDTLLLVATRECEMMMVDVSRGESRKVLFSLFWALQGSLLSWCYLQLKGGSPIAASLAKEILVKYVEQFLSSSHSILASLLVKHSGKEIVERLTNSVLAMATRQLVIFLLELCSLDIPHCKLLRISASFIELFKSLGSETEDSFTKMDVENCQQSQQPVLLRTWNVESPHNYENNRHETTTFLCPGATYFEVEFDERCETEKRYDYLEFTDSRGGKIRYDMKVGTEKWPKKVTYKAGPRLQFLFHSDSSNNEWGYKFTVTAYGLPDITVSWASDLQLLVSRLMGRLASRTMALKSPYEIRCVKELPPGKTALVLNSPLWKTVFRHGMCTDVRASEAVINDKSSQTADTAKVHASPGDEIKCFLIEFAKWDPSQDASDSRTDLMKWLMQACKKHPPRNEIGGGLKVDQAVNAIFASMVYHTPALHRALMNYVSCGGQAALSEEFVQVYALAEGIRTWMLEMKQKYLVGKMNKTDKQEVDPSEVNMESLALTCIEKSLLLFKFNPSGTLRQHNSDKVKSEALGSRDERNGRAVLTRQRSVSISEGDFQASPSASSLPAEAAVKDPEARRQSQSQEPSTTSKPLTANPSQGVASAVSLIKASSDTSLPQQGDPSSPSTPTRKAPFSRGRLRLLSFRSMEEARIVPSIKEKYPILKHINDFMKDQTICQSNYFRHLDGCGKQLREEVRQSFYQLVLLLLNAVQSFNNLHDKTLLPALSCVQTCLLHLLDMSWEVQDLSLFIDIKLPDLLLTMSQENISVHDIAISQWTEDDEIADYERNMEWMEECQDGMFERWYDKITQAAPEDKRKMHMFIARYCDLLNVEISCDGCDKIAPWHRFRCLQCMDMDLCKTCFLSGAKPEGHEDDHEMVNMEYACDHCQGLIVGSRINCNVCDDFDLCFGCYNAKKYPDSHLPTHRITVFPMVTIRISDRHRLIQPYIHNYSWLLFAALALYTSDLASEGEVEGERLDSNTLASATNLQTRCTELIADCLLKGQNGKSSDSSPEAAAIDSSQHISLKQEDRATRVPIQEHVFAECSRERILGLLAAMLPPAKPGSTISVFNLRQTLPLLFQVVISNAGCLNETYHLTLGLLGQLLLRIAPADADSAVTEALADKYALLAQGEGTPDTQGWKTTQLLFSLGAVCLDSRIGLDWACSVADILRDLNACPQWCNVISAFTDHCVKQLPLQLKRTNLFTLLVLVGFPEVLCMGTHSVFIDNANEPHNMIILKHFTEKNRAAVVDVKTRKRRTVKDYQLVQLHGHGDAEPQSLQQAPAQSHVNHYLQNFVSITSHLLQTNLDSSSTEAVEATWVLALALKGLYNTLKKHGVEEAQAAILQSGLIKLLVRKCSKGTGFSKMWLLRDLEILSIMLYSSKKEIHSMAVGDTENEEKELEREPDSDHSSSCMDEQDQNKPDPLEGLDEETKICFQITHDALNAPLHILRAIFDGDVITTDETIRNLAQKWQAGKCPRSEERSTKAVDTDMIVVPCESKPRRCENATEETNLLSQKLITSTESDLQLSYAKQRRTKSSALLHKELDARSNKSVRQYLFKVNEAIGILYARHVLASLLSEWPSNVAVTEDTLELSGASHMAYILDMLMQLEEKQLWEKILQKVLQGCSESMLDSLSLTACQFMEEPGMAVQVRESKHPYDNNTTFEDKVHIPSAIYLSIKFDSRSHTEEGCDELLMSSSSDFLQDHHNFSGSSQKWTDFEIPGFEILKVMLADERAFHHLPLADIWEWQVGVACRQTGNLRLKAIHLLLRILVCSSESGCDLTLLRPLWQLFTTMESSLCQDPTSISVLLPLHRALTELFFTAESRAIQQGILQEYLLALTTDEQLHVHTVQSSCSMSILPMIRAAVPSGLCYKVNTGEPSWESDLHNPEQWVRECDNLNENLSCNSTATPFTLVPVQLLGCQGALEL
ncbi:UNVERIFIED_CONTAM: hypothetical protein FKN15_035503 [Acipenser sinensis]